MVPDGTLIILDDSPMEERGGMSKYSQLDIFIIIYQLEALCIMVAHVELLIHYIIGKPDINMKYSNPIKSISYHINYFAQPYMYIPNMTKGYTKYNYIKLFRLNISDEVVV